MALLTHLTFIRRKLKRLCNHVMLSLIAKILLERCHLLDRCRLNINLGCGPCVFEFSPGVRWTQRSLPSSSGSLRIRLVTRSGGDFPPICVGK